MKPFALVLFALFFGTQTLAANDDLILQSRFDGKTVSWLIEKMRLVLANSNLADGLTNTLPLEDDTPIPLEDLIRDPAYERLKETISRVFSINVEESYLRLRIPRVYYSIHSLRVKPKTITSADPLLQISTAASLQGVDVGLVDGIKIDFMISNPRTKTKEPLLTASLDPIKIVIPESLPPAEFEVDLAARRSNKITFELKGYNLDPIPRYVNTHIRSIETLDAATGRPISTANVSVDPVVIRLNNLTRTLSFDLFRPVIEKNLELIVSTILKEVGKSLKDSIGPQILNRVLQSTTPSAISLSSEALFVRYALASFDQPDATQLALLVSGGSCTEARYRELGEACVDHAPPVKPARIIPDADQTWAREELRSTIASGRADLALSVSEEHLNQFLRTSIDAKLWESLLTEQKLALGPKGAFVVLRDPKKGPELYLDVLYRPTTCLQRILIGRKRVLRFPLRIGTKVLFENRNENPTLIIQVTKVNSTVEEILRGIPEYELPSQMAPLFKKQIAKTILKTATTLEGRNVVEMEIPVLKGVGLDRSWHETSKHGRIHLYLSTDVR